MDTKIPTTVQNENLQIRKGKGIKADGTRSEIRMATQTSSLGQNENLHIYKDKGIVGVKADVKKSENRTRKDRKALKDLSVAKADVAGSENKAQKDWKAVKDLSNTGKPLVFGTSMDPIAQEKPSVLGSKTTKKVLKRQNLTDEQLKNCHEWAKEGIETCHFTGNDMQKLEKDMQEESIRKEVEKVTSSMSKWAQMTYDWGLLAKEAFEEMDFTNLELEEEVLAHRTSLASISGDAFEDSCLTDLRMSLRDELLLNGPFDLKMKEEFELVD